MSQTVELTKDLIARRSLTPADEGCQALMAERLEAAGFRIETLRYGNVENLWAQRGGSGPVFCFAGHTDVVPTGPPEEWTSDPFTPVDSRRPALWPRGGRYEEWPRRHGHGRRGLRPRPPAASRLAQLPDHER